MGHQHGMDGVSKTDHPILGYFGHPKFGYPGLIFLESRDASETPRTCGSLPFFWKGNALSGRGSFPPCVKPVTSGADINGVDVQMLDQHGDVDRKLDLGGRVRSVANHG